MWNRRQLLRLGLASWGLSALPRAALGAPTRRSKGPRNIVVLMLRGGVDGVYAFDPKERSQVAAGVDVPYSADHITEAGNLLLGPHYSGLRSFASDFAVVKGLQVKTANHESGALQMVRLKTAVSNKTPGILDIIGADRDDRPLGCVTLGKTSSFEHAPAAFGGPTYSADNTLLDRLDQAGPEEFALLSRVYAEHAERVAGWSDSLARDRTAEHLRQVQALFTRMPTVTPFEEADWGRSGSAGQLSADFQRTLWLLENDLARGVYLKVYFNWDSHFDNARKQRASSGAFVPAFARFLSELRRRRNAHGSLHEQTLVVAGSELARFPVLNGNDGKDHFPETTMLLSGAGVNSGARGAVYGETGEMMEGLPVSLDTGRPHDAGTHLVLDDLGTTLLGLCGFDPERYGYRGRHLRFLEVA